MTIVERINENLDAQIRALESDDLVAYKALALQEYELLGELRARGA